VAVNKRKKLYKQLDEVVSKYIRLRDGYCVQCGNPERLTNGHIFSRRHLATRWDISKDGNCHCQCWGCNYKHTKDNYDYYKWYTDRFGKKKFEKLRDRYTQITKLNLTELEELLLGIKEQYQLLESNKI
jgi:phosphoglucomutase